MPTYHEFDQKTVQSALATAAAHHDHGALIAAGATPSAALDDGNLSLTGGCISVTVEDGKICLNLPVAGKQCLPVPPIIPNGTAAEACIHICTTWGIPTGVKATISIAGKVIVTKSFGKC